ncbi:Guanine-nucleotide dissociation stimulator CDC25 [Penicillium italicum]|uniref:Guanine-nucleotide dissociation stimulator CDC25 n=1 Tax=Penicillium italicum TaxID=40296 RepID=A0A0A2L7I6_PENIT|nr:Guanine-nucleotide dissociation stimulator CDC25 [Penicillium italicum]
MAIIHLRSVKANPVTEIRQNRCHRDARQLTIMKARMFGKIQGVKLSNKNWQKKEPRYSSSKSELAPNIRALIRCSNQFFNWVGGLYSGRLLKRAVSRTWAMVTERSCNTTRPLKAIICSEHSYQAYRDTLWVAVEPCVPFGKFDR